MRDADKRLPIGAMAKSVEHLALAGCAGRIEIVGAVQHPRIDQPAVLLCLDGEMRIAVVSLQGRTVADRPVDQASAARNREPAGADPAQREGDVAGTLALVGKARIDGGKVVPHESYPIPSVLDAAHGDAFDHEFLSEEEEQHDRQDRHAHRRHHQREIA